MSNGINPLAALQVKAKAPDETSASATPAKPKLNFGASKAKILSEGVDQTKKALVPGAKPKLDFSAKPVLTQKSTEVFSQAAAAPPPDTSAEAFNDPSQPEKIDKPGMEAIREALNILEANITDKDLVAQSVRNVMLSLSTDPNLKDLLAPEDIGIMVRGLRESYGVAIVKKDGRRKKRDDAKVTQNEVDDLMKGFSLI